MKLPIKPVYLPMEAALVDEIPRGEQWQYESKWDGFRCLVFRDGDSVELQSKSGQPIARYFPELVEAVRDLEPLVGSLLLGLYDEDDLLHHVGFTSGIKSSERAALTAKLEEYVKPPGFTGRAPGGPSRWSTERSTKWTPLAPKLVVEVSYDHFTGGRFRHGTRLLRWRPDKNPRQCTMEQVERPHARLLLLLDKAS